MKAKKINKVGGIETRLVLTALRWQMRLIASLRVLLLLQILCKRGYCSEDLLTT
jgi:hypothetical protein